MANYVSTFLFGQCLQLYKRFILTLLYQYDEKWGCIPQNPLPFFDSEMNCHLQFKNLNVTKVAPKISERRSDVQDDYRHILIN